METDTAGNQIIEPVNCDYGLTGGCEKCRPFVFRDSVVNITVEKKIRKKVLSCPYCPPNQIENQKRNSKHFSKNWKDKTKNKKQYFNK